MFAILIALGVSCFVAVRLMFNSVVLCLFDMRMSIYLLVWVLYLLCMFTYWLLFMVVDV